MTTATALHQTPPERSPQCHPRPRLAGSSPTGTRGSLRLPWWLAAVALGATIPAACVAEETEPVVVPQVPLAPPMVHGSPNEAADQMCVVCHTCGTDGTLSRQAPIIDRQHSVCNECHGPDGGVVVHGDSSCEWSMDCNAIPPIINCNECHTVAYVNDLCEACHAP